MSESLYNKHRPAEFKRVFGQDAACSQIKSLLREEKMPHVLCLSGPSGVGKTTMIGLIAHYLQAQTHYYDCAQNGGIDMVRGIKKSAQYAPIGDEVTKLFCIDEAHGMSSQAKDAFLITLENPPPHAYFVFATTIPQKLTGTLMSRCMHIRLQELDSKSLLQVLDDVAKREGIELEKAVKARIVGMSENSARNAVQYLESVASIKGEDERMAVLEVAALDSVEAGNFVKLICNPGTSWEQIAPTIKAMTQDPESVRQAVLGYAQAILLNQTKTPSVKFAQHQHKVLEIFGEPGLGIRKPALTRMAYETFYT